MLGARDVIFSNSKNARRQKEGGTLIMDKLKVVTGHP